MSDGSDDVEEVLLDAEVKMDAAVDHVRAEFAKIRTGRANPQLLADLPVAYYGTATPLQQLAGITVPDARLLVVSPYDKSATREIERAISTSDLGLNPSNDGQVIRVVFPELTEERRREYVKLAKERAEEARIGVRNTRRGARRSIDRLAADGEIPDDDAVRAEQRLQQMTDGHVAEVDRLLANKETELMQV